MSWYVGVCVGCVWCVGVCVCVCVCVLFVYQIFRSQENVEVCRQKINKLRTQRKITRSYNKSYRRKSYKHFYVILYTLLNLKDLYKSFTSTLVLPKGGLQHPPTVFVPVLKNEQPRNKITLDTFKFIFPLILAKKQNKTKQNKKQNKTKQNKTKTKQNKTKNKQTNKQTKPTTFPWNRVSFQSWEVGDWCDPVI